MERHKKRENPRLAESVNRENPYTVISFGKNEGKRTEK